MILVDIESGDIGDNDVHLHRDVQMDPQGIRDIKQSPSRLDTARKAFEADAAKMKDFYMTTGQHDMIPLLKRSDDVALAKALVTTGAQGNVTTETCRAYTEDEYREIIRGLR